MGKTRIEWTDYTFNPWIGCAKVSAGCTNCYAERGFDKRRKVVRWGPGNPRKRTSEANWKQPLKWNRQAERDGVRRKVFCASLADVFDEEVSDKWRRDLFSLVVATPSLDWLLLTKRPENARRWFETWCAKGLRWPDGLPVSDGGMPFNIWLGVSVEDQKTADERIPVLLSIPAAVRFTSYEPALESVDFSWYLKPPCECEKGEDIKDHDEVCPAGGGRISWLIVGGESGPGGRPFDVQWARDTIRQCREAGVAVFMKQLGAKPKDAPERWQDWRGIGRGAVVQQDAQTISIALEDRKGGDPSEWPEDLRVRQFPEARG